MKITLSLIASLLISYTSIAQNSGGGRPGGGGQQMTGTMYGKIIEGSSSKPIAYASVQLLTNKFDTVTKKMVQDVVIGGMLTANNGDFRLENVPVFGSLKLRVSIVGFKSYEQAVSFDIKKPEAGKAPDMSSIMNALDKDLGNISIDIEEKMLSNVTVTSGTGGLQLGIDRKVFNVDKNIVSAGGTAVDIMRNVPSLNVDIDGNVSLRNNSPQIFVDGRPTTMELDQIPSDAIESIEIITNPSAKFDASGGTAGILNIILKKNRKVGYNGSIRTNLDSRGRIGLGGDVNIRQNKINAFVSLNYNQRRSNSYGTTKRLTFGSTPNFFLNQTDTSNFNGSFLFARAGFDYFINNRSTLSVSTNIASGMFDPYSSNNLLIDTLYNPVIPSRIKRISNSSREFSNTGGSIGFKHNFPKAGREITADINYRGRKGPSNNLISTYNYNPDQSTIKNSFIQRQIGDSKSNNVTFQTDYVDKLSDNSKMEMGVRAEFNDNTSYNGFYNVDPTTGQIIPTPTSFADYESNDRVLAAYATFSNRIKNFGYQLGLRAESSDYNGVLNTTSEKFNIDYPVSLFPSIFLSQKLKADQELQLNYSRRINRPNFWQLTPFIDSSDILNPSIGNPGLQPEFTNSMELSYQKIFKNKDNFLTSIYYKNTNNLITRFQEQQLNNGKDIIMNTYINASSSYVTGLELTMKNSVTKWWELVTNFNLFTSKITIDDPSITQQDPFASWFAKINNTFKATSNLSFQLSGSYQSKTILPPGGSGNSSGGGRHGGGMFGQTSSAQGYVRPVYYVDMAVRYSFLKENRATLSLNMSDVFKTRVSDIYSESAIFTQDVTRRRDPQVVRLNFNWRFGKFDASLFKRKNNKQGDSGIDMGGMAQ